MIRRLAAGSLAVAALALAGAGCGRAATDPAGARTCEELIDRSAKVAAQVIAKLGDKKIADLKAENPAEPFRPLTQPFEAFRLRARELQCDEGELRRLACGAYERLKPNGPAAEEYLASFMQTCRG